MLQQGKREPMLPGELAVSRSDGKFARNLCRVVGYSS